MSKERFDQYLGGHTVPDFEAWWLKFYGKPEDYSDVDEFWVRKCFALYGWLGARGSA